MAAEAALKLVETEPVEEKALTIVDQARAVVVKDSQTYTAAGMLWKSIGEMIKEVKDTFDPICEAAHLTHKKATEKRAKYLDPLAAAQKSVKQLMSAYDAAQEAIRKAEEERLAAISRKEEEDRRLAEAVMLEKAGDMNAVNDILDEPIYVPPVVVPKSVPKMAGGPVYREVWSAEIIDIRALCGAVSHEYICNILLDKANKMPESITKKEIVLFLRNWNATAIRTSTECVIGNMVSLNRQAVALKGTMNVPGVKAYSKRV